VNMGNCCCCPVCCCGSMGVDPEDGFPGLLLLVEEDILLLLTSMWGCELFFYH
jgi:hypothetical protein